MLFSPKTLGTLALAALLAGPALAQQPAATTKTKTKRKAAAVAAPAVAPPAAPAGTPPPPPAGRPDGGPQGPRGPHGPHGGTPRAGRALQPVQALSGTVTRYVTNAEGFYDGFELTLNGQATTVHFPLHMAKAVMAAAKPGQSISFGAVGGGRAGAAPADAPAAPTDPARLELVSVQAGGTPLLMTPPAPPRETDTTPAPTSVAGRITERRLDERGHLRGLVLADNTLLLVSPQVDEQLGDKLKVGETIQATGAVRPAREGMVAASDQRRLHAQTLTVGGVQFLVR